MKLKIMTISSYFFFGFLILFILISKINLISRAEGKTNVLAREEKFTFNFEDIELRTALKLLAEINGINLIVTNNVKGKMSLTLNNVNWQTALDCIVLTQNLAKKQINTTLFIASQEEMLEFDKKKIEIANQRQNLEALSSVFISLKHANADELSDILKDPHSGVLSSRGSIIADMRTNSIWLKDTPKNLTLLQQIIKELDIPIRQLLIEVRIVNIDQGLERDLGVRFGFNHSLISKDNREEIEKESGEDKSSAENGISRRLSVDFPVAYLTQKAGSAALGLGIIRLGKNNFLDLELSALESEGFGQIISTPHLVTSDQQEASIEAGEEIPYQQKTSRGGTNVSFKKAVLSLNVTPQILKNNKILLNLRINQDEPSQLKVHDVPAISTRQIKTQVIVNNDETVVLGGIYEFLHNNEIERIPFLSKIPILGLLFTQKAQHEKRKELLIFVTPHILPLG